ncbi:MULTISPECIES: IS3 family transposase [Rickettsiales]|uniref:IS3 family transposase n=1 Tax=Wolbachia TaxID=953 RepID=UPI0012BA8DEE|nr:IS3 family transposase [Wolbachia pipientis]QUI60884.1 IS3 family transposase [Wolbachia endosymbiont of Spodoptera picta]
MFCQPKGVKYSFIKDHRNSYKIQELCRFLNVSACGYYKWVAQEKSNKELAREELLADIQKIYQASQCRYGAPKIHAELKALGKNYNIKTVQDVMQKNGIQAKLRRRFKTKKQQTDSRIIAPNILDQNFTTDQPNKVWVTDITYIKTKEGWLYLAAIIDLYSRMVVGWSMSSSMDKQLIIDALFMAVNKRKPAKDLLFHSDQGSQYTSKNYQFLLNRENIISSMSHKGCCYDNSPTEKLTQKRATY